MAHTNNSYDNHEESDMHPDYNISLTNSSDKSALNGSLNNHHSHPNRSYDDSDSLYDSYHYSELLYYQLHHFEGNIYVYVWTFLVILTTFGNVIIVAVFVRKSMRTTTNLILLFIAISDSLTGFVTLPTYMHVFTSGYQGWVGLTEGWCEAFMISKFYVSKVFHTVSVWLTFFLGFQRFMCVWFPLKTKSSFTTRRTLIAVAIITVCAFVIHSYHLIERKADKKEGFCRWVVEDPCVGTCIFLWMTLLLVNLLPSIILLVLTMLMIYKLHNRHIRKDSFSAEQNRERDQQNKRASIIVVCIAIVFLIPEIPYGIFLLVTVIKKHSSNYILPLEANRLLHLIYEIALIISFHANFWVYIIMNRRFRDELKSMFRDGIKKFIPKRTTVTITTVSRQKNRSQSQSTQGTDVNEQSTLV
ncbi:hypothetical protein ACJMK2_007563 [Sinanodonta woodiana]|uniref:G-protein coupled receptors family 1 profile domain-containing protein n=1 Tax=Sinanodonta woodiana TaxID=1069815 RepID=A0ABD3VIX0_SINWO